MLALDDVVLYNSARYRIVAMSHRGKVAIRHVSMHGGCGARWVPADCVSFHHQSGGLSMIGRKLNVKVADGMQVPRTRTMVMPVWICASPRP